MAVSPTHPAVLVVDDERELADLYTAWLADTYTVRTAYSGTHALSLLDETIDVVLLDRQLPDISCTKLLAEIQAREYAPRVALVTAVKPDFDIIEMGFDDYVTEPVSAEALQATVEQVLTRAAYDQQLREYFALVSKKAALDAEKSPPEFAANEEYAALEQAIAETRATLDETYETLDEPGFQALLRDLPSSDSDST